MSDFGPALGNMSMASHVAKREFSAGTVTLDLETLDVALPSSLHEAKER